MMVDVVRHLYRATTFKWGNVIIPDFTICYTEERRHLIGLLTWFALLEETHVDSIFLEYSGES